MSGVESHRIIVLGYIVREPLGGMAWHYLQYVLGLHRLGHDVLFVEDSGDYESCYDPTTDRMGADPAYGLKFTADAFQRLGLGGRWAYYDGHTSRWLGPSAAEMPGAFGKADLLLNISGVNRVRPWCLGVPRLALVDTDPGFTQLRHLMDPAARHEAELHHSFFTFGENFGSEDCLVPQDGFPWQPTRQPVVLDSWPVTPGPAAGLFTTVTHWHSQPLEFDGFRCGTRAESFEPYKHLPDLVGSTLEIAVGSPSAPRAELRRRGWNLRTSLEPTRDLWTYQKYIQDSKGEFSVAKHGYVSSRSGWFSERSAAYLASGRPVVTQETGFSSWLDADTGLLSFSSPAEALEAIESVNRDYANHCKGARAVAEEYFDARSVLASLISHALVGKQAQDGPSVPIAR